MKTRYATKQKSEDDQGKTKCSHGVLKDDGRGFHDVKDRTSGTGLVKTSVLLLVNCPGASGCPWFLKFAAHVQPHGSIGRLSPKPSSHSRHRIPQDLGAVLKPLSFLLRHLRLKDLAYAVSTEDTW